MTFTPEQTTWIPVLIGVIGAGGIWWFIDYFFRWRPFEDDE
jgi:hypothetical protein